MHASTRRATLLLLVAVTASAGCDAAASKPEIEVNAAPAAALPSFEQEIASQKAEVTLPGSWKFGYHLVDRPDTTMGALHAIEFVYGGDSVTKVPARTLLVIRVYKKAAWERIVSGQKSVSSKLAEHDNTVYAYSIVTSNPYPLNTAAWLRVEAMMVALTAQDSPFKIAFK